MGQAVSGATAARVGQALRAPAGGLSQVAGLRDEPLSTATVHQLLQRAARAAPGRDAAVFVEHDDRLSWARLLDEVEDVAAGLWSFGVRAGDRVGIWSPNRPEWLLVQFATARIGAILVNINPAYRVAELDYALNKAGVSLLVTAANFKSSHYIGMLQALGAGVAHESGATQRLPQLRTVVRLGDDTTPGMVNWSELVARGRVGRHRLPEERTLSCHDPINIQFTSGTTGSPKGATLTHHNIVNNALAVAACMRLTPQDALCVPVPLYHCFGMVIGNMACVTW